MSFGNLFGEFVRVLNTRLAPALIAGCVLVGPASAEEFGTIKGRLIWGGAEVPKPTPLNVTKDLEVCLPSSKAPPVNRALVVDPKSKGVGQGFAYVINPKGSNPEAVKALLAKEAEVVIDQKACEFVPYSTAVHKDQPVVLKSSDPVNHNVRYSALRNNAYNKILPPNGEDRVKLVPERGPLPLQCDIHPWMKGALMVFDHPFFAVTEEDGSFEISGVPAGPQALIVRVADGKYVTPNLAQGMPVVVKAGEVTDVGDVKYTP